MKKITLFLALLCAFITAKAETFTVNGLCYLHQSGSIVQVTSASNYATTLNGELTIPSEVTYNGTTYTVTAIGYRAFGSCNGLTSVNLPEGLKNIFVQAFYNCENLVSIHLPSTLISIDAGAFLNCKALTSITIPASVQIISGKGQLNEPNRGPFYGCDNLETIVVESGNQTYDSRDNCNAVVETATNTLIFGCKGSTIPNSVIVGKGSFKASSITDIVVPEGVTTIEDNAFNSSQLKNVTLESVTTIGSYAFGYCPMLENVTLPNTLKSIDVGAFYSCPMLKTLAFPASLENIGYGAFTDCTALTDLYAYPAGGDVTLGENVWLNVPQSNCYLHVYPADYEYYRTADQWKEFKVVGNLGEDGVFGDVTGDGNVDIADVNAAINIILGKATVADYPGNANIAGDDDTIDIADVNAIINIILNK